MKRYPLSPGAAALGLALSLAPMAARAQTAPDAALEARYQQGADLRERQQDAQALAIFQEIYAQTRQPRALAQVGMAEGALGRWLDAEQHLAEALNTADVWVTTRRAALEGALTTIRTHLGQLEVQTSAPGAEVWIDGRRAGAANTPLRVLAGTAHFEVRAQGHAPVARVATVPAGGLAREAVVLVAEGAAPATAPTAAPAQPTPVRAVSAPSAPAAAPATSARRTLAWASIITGGVLLVGGVAAWSYGWSVTGDYNADPSCPAPGAGALPAACQSRYDTAQTMEPLGWVGMLTGAALIATGGVLLGTAPREARERALRVAPGPGQVGAGLRWVF